MSERNLMKSSANTVPAVKEEGWWETVKVIVQALLIALVVRTALFQPFNIPSGSMEATLLIGDYLFVEKFAYGYSQYSFPWGLGPISGRVWAGNGPQRGDVIVFKLPRSGHVDYIKRLVGLPGDRIQVRAGRLYINDKPVGVTFEKTVNVDDRLIPEQAAWVRETNPEGRRYLTQIHGQGAEGADNTGVYQVPPHCYFMMGDNRENSLDSRFDPGVPPEDPKLGACGWDSRLDAYLPPEAGVGFVPEENLVGRAEIVLLSWKQGASIFKPWTWLNLRGDRVFRRVT